jgi:pimeloyl-ACP methyl ester carboxylesterase
MSENTHITNRPLVFIHGAWHGAWCWDPWIEIFKNQGYSATAIELRGHGYKKGEYKHARLEDYIVDVETVLNTDWPLTRVFHYSTRYIHSRLSSRCPSRAYPGSTRLSEHTFGTNA